MRLTHFEALQPLCLACRHSGRGETGLVLGPVEAEDAGDILMGILACPSCGAEYPIIDGLPVLVPELRRFLADNLFMLLARRDLPPMVESLLGDAAGPGSALEHVRQHVSSYAWDHWGEYDAPAPAEDAAPGSVARTAHAALALAPGPLPAGPLLEGPLLDIGSGGGRVAAELATAHPGRLVLAIDLSVPLARLARRALTAARVDYDRRRIGLVYDRRGFDLPGGPWPACDVWICDALALPFTADRFALATGMNVLDCLADPRAGLIELARVLQPGGRAALATPFDWAPHATPPEAWLGGHSQRGPHGGAAEPILQALLAEGPLATGLIATGFGEAPWQVRLHERSAMRYRVHLAAAEKRPCA